MSQPERRPDRLVYAQNWEDPRLELEALAPAPGETVVAIAGGGCTALSLLARAPARVVACDLSEAQLRVTALKRAAVTALDADEALAFLGGAARRDCGRTWQRVRTALAAADRAYWDERPESIAAGVLTQGRAERFLAILAGVLRTLVHPRARVEELFAQPDLEAQRRFYRERWDTRRWRLLFKLLHKKVFDRALDPAFYRYVDPGDLGEQLRRRAERCLLELPARENYFLARMLLGTYLPDPEGRPPYLQPAGAASVARHADRLELRHARVQDVLATLPPGSVDKLYLSNVAEWLNEPEREALFRSVVRAARPGAIVCWRALMVDRPVPDAVAQHLEEDSARSAALAARDRAFINAAFHVATVRA